jgi:hypothetical protein
MCAPHRDERARRVQTEAPTVSSHKNKRAKRNRRRMRSGAPGPISVQPTSEVSSQEVSDSLPPEAPEASASEAAIEAIEAAPTEAPVVEAAHEIVPPAAVEAKIEAKIETKIEAAAQAEEAPRVTDPPSTLPDSPSARVAAVAQIDTSSVAPVTRDAEPNLDFDDHDHSFFAKPVEEVHADEVKRDLVHDEPIVAAPRKRRMPDRKARSIVVGVLGVCALIGATAMVRKATSATRSHAPTSEVVAMARPMDTTPPEPPAAEPPRVAGIDPTPAVAAAPPPEATNEAPAPTTTTAETAAPAPTTTEAAAPPPPPAPTAEAVAAAPATTATTATTAAAAPTDPADDPDASLSAGQLLANARSAMSSGNNVRAAALAKKAIAKGAGGSAHYVLGAAYQMMGASMGAKNEYSACAKSGAPEASECAALVDTMSPKTEPKADAVKDPKSW